MHITKIIRDIILKEDYRWSKEYQAFQTYAHRDDIYVRFTTQPMIKKVFTQHIRRQTGAVEHGDPSGVYAFPLRFVLNHYANLATNTFFSMPYITILQDTSQRKLMISDPITYRDAVALLEKLFDIPSFSELCQSPIVQKAIIMHLPTIREASQQEQQQFFTNIIHKSDEYIDNVTVYRLTRLDDRDLKTSQKTIKLASSDRQRLRWIRAGFDAIEDVNSVIFPLVEDEKEQIIFLTEQSFEILENITRSGVQKAIQSTFGDDEKREDDYSDILFNQQRLPYFMRRIIVAIMKMLNDRLVDITTDATTIETYGRHLKNFFFVKDVINEEGSMSKAQSLVGRGKQYVIQILATKHRISKKQEYYIFDIGIFDAVQQSVLFTDSIESKPYHTFELFLDAIQKRIQRTLKIDHKN